MYRSEPRSRRSLTSMRSAISLFRIYSDVFSKKLGYYRCSSFNFTIFLMKSIPLMLTSSMLLSTVFTLSVVPETSAMTFNVNGMFEDGGKISGSFDFNNDNYTNVNLQTTDSSDNIIASYSDTGDEGFIFGNSSGFVISNFDFSFDLSLDFESNLTDNTETILLTTSQEENFDDMSVRFIDSGTVTSFSTQVDEPSSLFLISTFGLGLLFKRLLFS